MKNAIVTAALTTAIFLSAAPAFAHGDGEAIIVVNSVNPGGPAAAAGLEVGDTILRINGHEIAGQKDLKGVLASHRPGDEVLLTVERKGEKLELALTFGEHPGGGVSVGVSLAIRSMDAGATASAPGETLTRDECVAWVDETYRVDSMMKDLGLDLWDESETLNACLTSNVQLMPSPMPVGWCDNAFKIHCSALDLLTEIGEAQVDRCEELLGEKPSSCASQKVFDHYMRDGEASDEAACRAAYDSCSDSK